MVLYSKLIMSAKSIVAGDSRQLLDGWSPFSKTRTSIFPWYTTPVRGMFLKFVSEEDMKNGKGRPTAPKDAGKWRTKAMKNEQLNKYAYGCFHVA
jgi:hypothetical protein